MAKILYYLLFISIFFILLIILHISIYCYQRQRSDNTPDTGNITNTNQVIDIEHI